MEESKRLVVRGFVQGVGYRAFVKQVAYRLGVRGTVKNLQDGAVEIYAKAEPEVLERFKNVIKSESPGEVEKIAEYSERDSGYGKAPEEWIGFNVLRDDYSSLDETMEYVILSGLRVEKEIKNGFSELGGKIDTVGEKVDLVAEKTDKGFEELGEKVDTGFSELGDKVDTGFSETGKKLDDISGKLDINTEKTVELHTERWQTSSNISM